MNGAIAEPWVSTMSAPTTPMTIRTGSNQNFLRISRKVANSRSVDTATASELIFHRAGCWARRLAVDPIGPRRRVELKPQRIFAERPHDHADRDDRSHEHHQHDHRRDKAVQQERQSPP